jgi:hypothetical protein
MVELSELAGQAVDELARRLPNLAGSAADALVDLINARLGATRTGSRALDSLRANPTGEAERELANAVLGDEMQRDPAFAASVAQHLGRPELRQSSVTLGTGNIVRGDVAGRDIDKSKRYHIGSIRFGGGGLTALIAIAVLGAGGGGVAAYNAIQGITEPTLVETRTGSEVTIANSSYDLDAEDFRVTAQGGDDDGDKIVDVTFGTAKISSTGGAIVAPLRSGVVPSPDSCGSALRGEAVPTISALKAADVVCVRTRACLVDHVTDPQARS